jgi:hypothetical protein
MNNSLLNDDPPLVMTALQAILFINVVPMSVEKPCTVPSKSEMKRWLDQQSVVINGVRPSANDIVEFPVTELIFFPKGKRRTTVI